MYLYQIAQKCKDTEKVKYIYLKQFPDEKSTCTEDSGSIIKYLSIHDDITSSYSKIYVSLSKFPSFYKYKSQPIVIFSNIDILHENDKPNLNINSDIGLGNVHYYDKKYYDSAKDVEKLYTWKDLRNMKVENPDKLDVEMIMAYIIFHITYFGYDKDYQTWSKKIEKPKQKVYINGETFIY